MNKINVDLTSSADSFLRLYDGIDKTFSGKLSNELEKKTVLQLKKEIAEANQTKEFHTLSRFEARIATLNMTLGELATERIKQANVAFRYTKWRRSSEWNSSKRAVTKDVEKALVGDIENEVVRRVFADMMLESYVQGLADYLETLHDDVRQFLTSLTHRIKTEFGDYYDANKTAQ